VYQQALNPTGKLFVFRLSAWKAVLVGAIVTFVLAMIVWGMPVGVGIRAYIYGSLTGIWAVDWITFWGVMLFNSLTLTGVFDQFRRWLIAQGTADVRVQAILFAWAFGALLEGLVGFGYPWAFVAPILVGLGIPDFDALRVAAIANNAPVSYGALGVPIIALSAVTGLPLLALSASVAHIVAVLALLPPWVLIYLVAGRTGFRDGWPLAVVGSLAISPDSTRLRSILDHICQTSRVRSLVSQLSSCCSNSGGRGVFWDTAVSRSTMQQQYLAMNHMD
jgi:lactate permease